MGGPPLCPFARAKFVVLFGRKMRQRNWRIDLTLRNYGVVCDGPRSDGTDHVLHVVVGYRVYATNVAHIAPHLCRAHGAYCAMGCN